MSSSSHTTPDWPSGPEPDTAWYLRVHRDEVPDGIVLVGDRARALMSAEMLDDVAILNEDRGLTTVRGTRAGVPIMVSAFGMGAPIATVVLHELAALGATRFVRAGTMMSYGSSKLGDFIIAERAMVHEGTTPSYGLSEEVASADPDLTKHAAERLSVGAPDATVVTGTVASCDGFYSQMTDALGAMDTHRELRELWTRHDVVGIDMETSALFSVGGYLGVRVASVCLASVDMVTNARMDLATRQASEVALMETALDTLATFAAG